MDRLALSLVTVRQRLHLFRWLVPLGLFLLVIVYEIGPARWTAGMGRPYHVLLEIVLFALVGPTLAFLFLDFTERWLEERDTSDLQAQVVARAQTDVVKSRELCDDAVQALFSAGTLIASLKVDMQPEETEVVETAEAALNEMVGELRHHLEAEPDFLPNGNGHGRSREGEIGPNSHI